MRFLVDMPLSPELAKWLVRQGHDAVHALEGGMQQGQVFILAIEAGSSLLRNRTLFVW